MDSAPSPPGGGPERRFERKIQRPAAELQSAVERLMAAVQEQTAVLTARITQQMDAMAAEARVQTGLLLSMKEQLAKEFEAMRQPRLAHGDAELPGELGRNIAALESARGNLAACASTIKRRCDESLAALGRNRAQFDGQFKRIFDEYDGQIRSVGRLIFEIESGMMAVAKKAATLSAGEIFSLPREIDQRRVQRRADILGTALERLKAAQLDPIRESLDRLEKFVDRHAVPGEAGDDTALAVMGIYLGKPAGGEVFLRRTAAVSSGEGLPTLVLSEPPDDFSRYGSQRAVLAAGRSAATKEARPLEPCEVEALQAAAGRLRERGMIATEDCAMLDEFLKGGGLRYL